VVEPLRAPVQIEPTALYQANAGALPEEFTSNGNSCRTRADDAEIGVDEVIARELSCVTKHMQMPPSKSEIGVNCQSWAAYHMQSIVSWVGAL
jgi:hypothetical protein